MKRLLDLLFLFQLFITLHSQSQSLLSFIGEKEAQVARICDAVRLYYSESEETVTDCDRFWSCAENLEDLIVDNSGKFECTAGFGDEEWCDGCSSGTSKISLTHPTMRYAPGTDIDSKDVAVFSCFTHSLRSVFRENYMNVGNTSWQYIGSPTGAFNMFPGSSLLTKNTEDDYCKRLLYSEETCPDYDPRLRPWYIASASGPKDVVLVLDSSGSMGDYGRFTLMKEAAKSVINGLGVYDRATIVSFSNDATACPSENLVRGTSQNKEILEECINTMNDDGGTNFESGFRKAFKIFGSRDTSESTCHNVILFLTDGEVSDGKTGSDLLDYIKEENNVFDAKIFTFSMGSEADVEIPKQIACDHKGVWIPIEDKSEDLRTKMSSYYNYFIHSNHTRGVVWSEMYEAFSGLGEMTTVAQGCFSESEKFFGVAGLDVLLSDFEKYGDFEEDVFPVLFERSNKCYDLALTDEQLHELRVYSQCYNTLSSNTGTIVIVVFLVLALIFCCSFFCVLFLTWFFKWMNKP